MRTKTLLIAAAALAATVIASEAQTVFSANVVGYVNESFPAGGNFSFVENPLTTGNDVLSNVLTGVQGGTIIQVWDPVGMQFLAFTFGGIGANKHWKDGSNVNQDNFPVPPGVGFFYLPANPITNTFVGSVVAPVGGSATNALTGSTFAPVGNLVPYAGVVTNTAVVNLAVGGGSILQQWDFNSQSFLSYTYSGLQHTWKDGGGNPTNPVVNVGDAFFIFPSANYNWVQSLTNN